MALPKALLCVLGHSDTAEIPEESRLRASGFATATLQWAEVSSHQRGWMQLLPIVNDPAVQAWVFAGHPADFTDEVHCQIAMLTLAITRSSPPLTAFVLTGSGEEPQLTNLLDHIRIFRGNAAFAAKLAAARLKPQLPRPLPFHVKAHIDPLIGQWFEVGPDAGESWNGFMIGVVEAETIAFGVGARGLLPEKSTLHYPQCGIKGEWGGHIFSACAARNELGPEDACYVKVEGCPRILFVTQYPDDQPEGAGGEYRVRALEIF
ncbi:hypothetical protein LJC22_01205 [Desulfosarcina sp. OttesenSCG-928-G10]|nr:hypothetical protein [Desulfosarcina sp. OttesenSCG-928-G10]